MPGASRYGQVRLGDRGEQGEHGHGCIALNKCSSPREGDGEPGEETNGYGNQTDM
jgi:hypothetical protein